MVMAQNQTNNAFVTFCSLVLRTFELTSLSRLVTILLKARKDDIRSAVRQSSLQSMYWLSKTIEGGSVETQVGHHGPMS